MGWGLLPEGNEGSQPSVAVASALCKHLATQEEEEGEEEEEKEEKEEEEEERGGRFGRRRRRGRVEEQG